MTEGEEVFFAVKVNGQPQSTLIWYRDGKEFQSDYSQEIKRNGSLSLPSTETRHTGVCSTGKEFINACYIDVSTFPTYVCLDLVFVLSFRVTLNQTSS